MGATLEFVEGFRISRTDEHLIIAVTDYHARTLSLDESELAKLGLRMTRQYEPETGVPAPKDDTPEVDR